jgi:hypothetical protein
VILDNGLEEIGTWVFAFCRSLIRIVIPPIIRLIKKRAFWQCRGLTNVILGDGLEEIEEQAFLAALLYASRYPPTSGWLMRLPLMVARI